MIIAGQQENTDTAALLRLLIDHKITVLALVPSLLRLLVAEAGLEACTSLRHVICFGEPLPVDVEERFCQRLPAAAGHFLWDHGSSGASLSANVAAAAPGPWGTWAIRSATAEIYILGCAAVSQYR